MLIGLVAGGEPRLAFAGEKAGGRWADRKLCQLALGKVGCSRTASGWTVRCGFHRLPISDSDSSRSPIPTDADHGFRHADRRFRHADHRFQGMSITDSGACRSPWSKRVAALENLT